ncbi:hypothetical protein C0993_004318, partial [Termitomyces sp. T159_Od127]
NTATQPHPEIYTDISEAGQKRKRGTSPDLPEKRQALGSASPSSEQLSKPPALLEGEAADDWRKQIIQLMFPGTNVKPERVLRDRDDFSPKSNRKGRKFQTNGEFSLGITFEADFVISSKLQLHQPHRPMFQRHQDARNPLKL